ncbi:hypothetical protein UFOVP811_29 [uncultured Caudovirales phage]|uniref:Uncharacterized protein n=1 Tax=uncultured Caudovirales phage TaxID=2100421 RepID=A0A6J5NUR1_9CAUD|nr:hypothetical protein UFOVP811_29 [uncultured Caudovirales phage]
MKVAQISDLANLADGSVIGEMRVTIKATFPPKTGEGKFGPWRVQNCVLQDSTGECRASFWLPDEMGDLKGQMVTLKSQAGKKGLQGISVKHSTHSGENELKITDQCAIIDDAGAAVAQAGPRKPVQASSPISLTVADAKRALFQAAQLMAEAIKAAEWVGSQAQVTPEQLQAIATSLFISADRAGFAKAFPSAQTKPVKKDEPVELEEDDLKW